MILNDPVYRQVLVTTITTQSPSDALLLPYQIKYSVDKRSSTVLVIGMHANCANHATSFHAPDLKSYQELSKQNLRGISMVSLFDCQLTL